MKIPLIQDIQEDRKGFRGLFVSLAVLILLYLTGSFVISGIFCQCLKNYYGLKPAKVLCIGHSMSSMGIHRTLLEKRLGVPVSQYCMSGVGPQERTLMLKHYLEITGTAPAVLVYDVNARLFASGLSLNSHLQFSPFMMNSKVCSGYIRKHASAWEYYFLKWNPLCCYDNDKLGAVQRGLTSNWNSRKVSIFDPEDFRRKVRNGSFWHIDVQKESLSAFEEMLAICQKNKIRVVLACLPSVDILNQAEPEKYEKVMTMIRKYAEGKPDVFFFDYNPAFSGKYELFGDPIHLRPQGQMKLTEALANDIRPVISVRKREAE